MILCHQKKTNLSVTFQGRMDRESAAGCLRHEARPTTPKDVKKYRKSFFEEPGKRVNHWGAIDDSIQLLEKIGTQRLGSRSDAYSDNVSDVFSGSHAGSFANVMNKHKEALNHQQKAGTIFVPREQKRGEQVSSKDLIYSMAEYKLEDALRDQYKKSHNSYQPGEQRDRKYEWKDIDPKHHRFGAIESKPLHDDASVASCLRPESKIDQTRIVNLAVENHRSMNTNILGKSKYRGNLDSESTQRLIAHQNKMKQVTVPEWSARQCLQGEYKEADQHPDEDLGCARRPGFRNFTNGDRVFGTPSVRTDIKPPTTRSISDSQNYGDDTNAAKLLYPSRIATQGLDESDFSTPLDRGEIRDVMERIGYTFNNDEFEKLYVQTIFVFTGEYQESLVSIKEFLQVMNERLDALDRGSEPQWW